MGVTHWVYVSGIGLALILVGGILLFMCEARQPAPEDGAEPIEAITHVQEGISITIGSKGLFIGDDFVKLESNQVVPVESGDYRIVLGLDTEQALQSIAIGEISGNISSELELVVDSGIIIVTDVEFAMREHTRLIGILREEARHPPDSVKQLRNGNEMLPVFVIRPPYGDGAYLTRIHGSPPSGFEITF